MGTPTVPLNPYTTETRTPKPTLDAALADELKITATNISEITIDPRKAQVSCSVDLQVKTDGPLTVHLVGCGDHTFGT